MTIRIPDSAFVGVVSTGRIPGFADPDLAGGVRKAQATANKMVGVKQGVEALAIALAGGEGSEKALAIAKTSFQRDAGVLDPAIAEVIDQAADLQAARTASTADATARTHLFQSIRKLGALPLSFSHKAELGRSLLRHGLAQGLLAPGEESALLSIVSSGLVVETLRQKLSTTQQPGDAEAVISQTEGLDLLLPEDRKLVDSLVQRRGEADRQRHLARLAWKETDDLAAFKRGELPEPLSKGSFDLRYGSDAQEPYARYLAARARAEALAWIRGRPVAERSAAKARWKGNPAIFAEAVAIDDERRKQDPLRYVLETTPGLREAQQSLTGQERVARNFAAQAEAGIPELQRSPWTLAQEEQLAAEWDSLPAGYAGRNERIAYFRKYVLTLPPEQRAAAIHRLVARGIVDGTEGEIERIVSGLAEGLHGPARRQAASLTPADVVSNRTIDSPVTSQPDAAIAPQGSGEDLSGRDVQRSDWRLRGLPNTPEDIGAWEVPAYESAYQAKLSGLAQALLDLFEDPRLPSLVADYESAEREGRQWSAPAWATEHPLRRSIDELEDPILKARLGLALDVILDPSSQHNLLGAIRDDLLGLKDRVDRGLPFDKQWASNRAHLAALEQSAQLKLRPSDAPGLVAIFESGREESHFAFPLPVIALLADEPDSVRFFASLAGKLARGEDVSAELALLEERLVRSTTFYDEHGYPQSGADRRAFNQAIEAIEGAKAALRQGADPDEVFLHLAQVVLADELDDTDLAVVALETALELLPFYDAFDFARSTADLVAALLEGDADAAWAAGLTGALAAIGAFPVLGDFAKSGLQWALRKTGIVSPRKNSHRWLVLWQAGMPSRELTGIMDTDARRHLEGEFGIATQSNQAFIQKHLDKLGLQGKQRERIERVFATSILGRAGEGFVADELDAFVEGSGFRMIRNRRHIHTGIEGDRYSVPDFLIAPENTTNAQFDDFVRNFVEEQGRQPISIFDAKTGSGRPSPPQNLGRHRSRVEGLEDSYQFYKAPQTAIPASYLAEATAQILGQAGRQLSVTERQMIMRLAQSVQRTLPADATVFAAQRVLLKAAAAGLGLTIVFDTEPAH